MYLADEAAISQALDGFPKEGLAALVILLMDIQFQILQERSLMWFEHRSARDTKCADTHKPQALAVGFALHQHGIAD